MRLLTALAIVAAGLVAPTATAAAEPCGYWYDETYAYYSHCGPTKVKIDVDVAWGRDYTACVKPGRSVLGTWPQVTNAWYIGLC
ncbi:DUF6355 family natural product biosynthesis protein [Allokutzneria multivorans]|uniref:DUF6355 family natural product biosynthesis protein n=1 Tax=Allokutzneria multivorans TaxID=1142134 RepID=UPI0031EA729F